MFLEGVEDEEKAKGSEARIAVHGLVDLDGLQQSARPPYTLHPRARSLPTQPLHLDRPGPGVLAVVSLTTCVRTTQPCTLRTQRQTTFWVAETSLKKQALQITLRMLAFP